MAGQTTVTMVLINKTTQSKGRTDLLEGRFLFLQFGAGDTLTDNHDLYPPSNRPHFAALAAAEQNTTVCKKPTQSPPFPGKLQFHHSTCIRCRHARHRLCSSSNPAPSHTTTCTTCKTVQTGMQLNCSLVRPLTALTLYIKLR